MADVDNIGLVAALSFLSCIVSGLTSFGDAITFHILWSVSAAAGAVLTDRSALSRAVIYVTIMSLANAPLQAFFARGLLRSTLPYGFVMALTGAAMVPVGATLLFTADLKGLKVFVGSFFLIFAAARLSLMMMQPRTEVTQVQTVSVSAIAVPSAGARSSEGMPQDAIQVSDAPTVLSTAALVVEPLPGRIDPLIIEPISDKFGVKGTMLILAITGVAAGLLGGLLGVAGPPQMIAFALLGLHKDTVRAVAICYTLFELPTRLIMFTTAKGNVFDPERYGAQYAVTLVTAWAGSLFGTWLRRFADTERILMLMLVLVLLSSGILLGALDDIYIAAGFTITLVVWAAFLSILLLQPRLRGWLMATLQSVTH